jgi:ribosomal RNA-processing protein 8
MASKMEGARFRWINEQLYTTTGHQAKQMFDEDPSLFDIYHTGFSTQVSKWPLNPLEKIIAYVKSLPPDFVVADFGCGEAMLSQSVPHTVHSFDLVAANSHVIACDMAHVPLARCSVDVVVFCLSLMGSNVSDFVREARRVLKKGGLLKICEIASRIDSIEDFVGSVESFGFNLIRKDTISKMFLDFEFKVTAVAHSSSTPSIHLNPCIYKRR